MSYAERIRTTSSPPEALLVIAEGIDAVLAALAEPKTDDGWGGWAQPVTVAAIQAAAPAIKLEVDAARVKAIAACQQALAAATNPDDITALEARLRLLQDDGEAVDTEAQIGVVAVSTQVGDEIVTTLPTPNAARQVARAQFARDNNLWEFSVLDAKEFVDAFVKGGPLWLYHTARDEVMAMPVEWRRAFVEDISLDSPRTAQEVGRDILKDAEPAGNKGVALEGINGDD